MWWIRSLRLRDPQHELEVLDRVEVGVEAAGALGDRAADDEQMADVHRPERVGRRPVGLEERVRPDAGRGQLVGVGVDDVAPRVLVERLGDPQQGVGVQDVVVVEEGDELAGGQPQRRVGRGRDPAVALEVRRPGCARRRRRGGRAPA